MKKKLLIIFLSLLVLFIALILFLRFWNFDIPEKDYSDMMPERRNIPKETNAFDVYREAYSKITDTEKTQELFNSFNVATAKVKKFIEENKDAVTLLIEAKDMDYEEPDRQTYFDGDLKEFNLRILFELAFLHGTLQKDYDLNLSLLKSSLQSNEWNISYSVKIKQYKKVLLKMTQQGQTLKTFLNRGNVVNSFKESVKSEFEIQSNFLKKGDEMQLDGYIGAPAIFDGIKIKNFGNYIWQHNKTKTLLYIWYKDYTSSMGLPYQYLKGLETKHFNSYLKGATIKYYSFNGVGKSFLYFTYKGFDEQIRNTYEVFILQDALTIRDALRKYESDNGSKATQLSKLVPKYLERVPLDPFDGEKLRFDAERQIIYSVGQNLIDDGGKEDGDLKDNGTADFVVHLVPKEGK